MHVSHITANVKGGVDVDLTPKTVVVGKNTSGKTSVVSAIELALTGKVDDLQGRSTVADGGMLLSLAQNHGPELKATATLSDGSTSVATVKSTGRGKGGRPALKSPFAANGILPARDVRDVLTGSPETARRAILRAVVGNDDLVKACRKACGTYAAEFATCLAAAQASAPSDATTADVLITLAEVAAAAAKRASDESKAATTSLETTTKDLPPPPTDDEIAAAQARSQELATAWDSVVRMHDVEQRLSMLHAERQRAEAAPSLSAPTPTSTIPATPEAAPAATVSTVSPAILAAVRAVRTVADMCLQQGIPTCPVCERPTEAAIFTAAQNRCDAFLHEHTPALRAPSALAASVSPPSMPSISSISTMRSIAEIDADIAACQTALATLPENIRADVAGWLTANASLVPNARAEYARLMDVAGRWKGLGALKQVAAEGLGRSDVFKKLAKKVDTFVADTVDAKIIDFSARVQAYLPTGWTFGMSLTSKRGGWKFGLVRNRDGNEEIDVALSGAEWATVSAAAAAALGSDSPLRVLIPEERPFDADTLADVLVAFGKAVDAGLIGQVVVQSVLRPSRDVPGWTYVER